MRHAAVLALLTGLVLVAGCGGAGDDVGETVASADGPPRVLSGSAVPALHARARVLDQDTLAADAFEPEQLGAVLDDAGYRVGRERELSGKTETFDHVVARTLVFANADGADAYLAWLQDHPEEVLGQSTPAKVAAPGEDGFVLRLVPCGSCKKELPTFFAAWRRGATAGTLLAAGPGADEARFGELLAQADAAVG